MLILRVPKTGVFGTFNFCLILCLYISNTGCLHYIASALLHVELIFGRHWLAVQSDTKSAPLMTIFERMLDAELLAPQPCLVGICPPKGFLRLIFYQAYIKFICALKTAFVLLRQAPVRCRRLCPPHLQYRLIFSLNRP